MAWLQPDNILRLQKFSCHVAWVDACRYGLQYSKSWALACTSPDIAKVTAICNHNIRHESFTGIRNADGSFLSSDTAEYPAQLAVDIIKAVWPLPLPAEPGHTALTEWSRAAPGPRQDPCLHCTRHGPTDGAGLPSNNAALQPLQCRLAQWATEGNRHLRIAAHLAQGKPDCPLSEEEQSQVAHLALSAQPNASNDLLPSSHQWPPNSSNDFEQLPLQECEGNWKAAEDEPALLDALLKNDIAEEVISIATCDGACGVVPSAKGA